MVDTKKKGILLETGTNELEIMEFTISDNHFGINIAKVLELLEYQEVTKMPHSNMYIEGVFKPRDTIMTVVDLATYLKLPKSSNPLKDIFIVTNFNLVKMAFHVHTVETIHRISWEDIEKPDRTIYGGQEGLATGIARKGDKLITIIDFEKIVSDISPADTIKIEDVTRLNRKDVINKPILVAEDSPLLEKLLLASLHEAGFNNVEICTNGKEAWDKLNEYKKLGIPIEKCVSCVITDIEMPKMDGHRLTKLIKEDPVLKKLPVIIFSSLITDEMRVKGESIGATAQISKPEIARLVHVIDNNML